MRKFRIFLLGVSGTVLCRRCWPGHRRRIRVFPKAQASVPLVLTGGTVVDVTNWGRSARDQQDAIVVIRDGRIVQVGYRGAVLIPKGARVIDCTGKYLIPGLVDGYAGMNSQGQANANLYMGVTTVVVRNDYQHGVIDTAAQSQPAPLLH